YLLRLFTQGEFGRGQQPVESAAVFEPGPVGSFNGNVAFRFRRRLGLVQRSSRRGVSFVLILPGAIFSRSIISSRLILVEVPPRAVFSEDFCRARSQARSQTVVHQRSPPF